MLKLETTTVIDGNEVELETSVGNYTVYSCKHSCQYEPKTVLYFVDSDGKVIKTLSVTSWGGAEGAVAHWLEWDFHILF